jgi:hypothetical protein
MPGGFAAWRKSSHSAAFGDCVVVGAWRKSSHSASGECAEVGQDGMLVLVRDTEDRSGPMLVFGPVAWVAFLEGLRGAGVPR